MNRSQKESAGVRSQIIDGEDMNFSPLDNGGGNFYNPNFINDLCDESETNQIVMKEFKINSSSQ